MSELTTGFKRVPCAECCGTGELRLESENINENFEVEKQTVIMECQHCRGMGFMPSDSPH